jgi:hypothetical protein
MLQKSPQMRFILRNLIQVLMLQPWYLVSVTHKVGVNISCQETGKFVTYISCIIKKRVEWLLSQAMEDLPGTEIDHIIPSSLYQTEQ